jgi:iron(II)-dependent oxidoreductase
VFRRVAPFGIILVSLPLLLAACTLRFPDLVQRGPCPNGSLLVPEGWFTMGEDDGRTSNQPQHPVYLDAYCIQQTEVTRLAYKKYVAATGVESIAYPEEEAQLPVVGVLWDEAQAYCDWLGMRLPTEAEWEKAARGEDGRRYPWGDVWEKDKANSVEQGGGGMLPVGSFPGGASPYGALDMSGNAAEWVLDYFDFNYYQVSPDHNPTGPTQVLDHGLRGGSYASTNDQATTYFRDSSHSVRPNQRAGFRCASAAQK